MRTIRWLAAASALLGITTVAPSTASAEAAKPYCYMNLDSQETSCFGTAKARDAAAQPAAILVVARYWDSLDFVGDPIFLVASAYGCTSDRTTHEIGVDKLGPVADKISSAVADWNCATRVFTGVNYGGDVTGWFVTDGNLGTFSNRVRSIQVS